MDHEGLTSCPGCTELIGTTSGNEKIILWPLAVHRFNIVRLIISPSVKQNQYDSVLPSTFGHEVYECPMDYASYLTYHCHIEAYNLCLNSDLSDDNIWLHWNDLMDWNTGDMSLITIWISSTVDDWSLMGETPNATSLIVMKTRIHQATFSPITDLISWYELLALNVEGKENSFLYLQIKRGNEMLWLLYLDEYFDQFNCKARSIQFI